MRALQRPAVHLLDLVRCFSVHWVKVVVLVTLFLWLAFVCLCAPPVLCTLVVGLYKRSYLIGVLALSLIHI